MTQSVVSTLIRVAEPHAASERVPVDPPGDKYIVSVVMAMLIAAEDQITIVVPMGKATEAFAGTVMVVPPAPKPTIDFPASDSRSV